jgi:signal transduction histidine kinase
MGGCIQKHLRSSYKNEQIAQGGVPTDSIFRVRSQLMEYALSHTLSEVLQVTLDAAEDFSNSSVAFYHFLEQDQETLSLQAWSTRTLADFCEAEGFGLHYPVSEAGVWGDAIRQRKPVIHNDYPNMTDKRGMPEGHAELIRELVVPIMRQDKIVAILGVGNKPTAYTEHDVTAVTVIADIAWEIVARKQAEQEVMRKAEQLARSNKELENFAYVASHDLQEPLRMVTSYLRLVERRYKNQLDEAGIEFIGYAVDGSKRMKNLIDHLLDYSRVNTRGKPFEKLDLNQIIKQVLFDLQFKIEEEAATITVDTFPTVMGDDVQLRSLIQNLVTNALKFRRDEPPVIHVGVREMKTEWLFSVEDNGIGIDPKFYERIFIIFQRLHQASEFSGTGIGLAISKRIVERHSGNIWVESKEGKGSTFYFTLPKALS